MVIFQESAVPATAVLVGLISWGVVDPITAVIVVPLDIPPPEFWLHVIVGEETVIEVQLTPVPENVTLVFARLLKEKPVAEGDAVFDPAPGNVIIILPLAGMVLVVVNWIVCFAVTGVTSATP